MSEGLTETLHEGEFLMTEMSFLGKLTLYFKSANRQKISKFA